MKLNKIPAAGKGSKKKAKRLGRGEGNGRGKTCCRGQDGSKSRSGYSIAPGFEGGQMPLFRKLPRRGFNNYNFRTNYNIVNLVDIEALEGVSEITNAVLLEKGLIRKNDLPLKVLGVGTISRAVKVTAAKFSGSAKSKIEEAGGEAIVA